MTDFKLLLLQTELVLLATHHIGLCSFINHISLKMNTNKQTDDLRS